MLNDPKYSTDFAHIVWQVSSQRSELTTLDFLSDNAARNISYLAAKAVIDNVLPEIHIENVLSCFYIPAQELKSHALGSVLSNEWKIAFGREFMEKVKEGMLHRIESEKRFARERAEREARIALAQAERQAEERAKALKILGLDRETVTS